MAAVAAAGLAAAAAGHTHFAKWVARLLVGPRREEGRPHCGGLAADHLPGRVVAAGCHRAAAVAAASSFEAAAGEGTPEGPQMSLVGPLPRVGTKGCCPGWVGLRNRGVGCGLQLVGTGGSGVPQPAGVGRHWDVLHRQQVGSQAGFAP